MSSNSGGQDLRVSRGGGGAKSNHKSSRNESSASAGNPRYSSLIYDSEIFLTKLREFKPQSLGCLEARRKSSSTLIFPNPQQACMGTPKCPNYPHRIKPTTGYWIECHGPGILPVGCKLASAGGVANVHDGSVQVGLSKSPADPSASEQQQQQQLLEGLEGVEGAERFIGGGESATGRAVKPDELRLTVDCASGRSSSSGKFQHHMPTTPTAERILTRHEKDVLTDQDKMDELVREDIIKLKRSNTIESESPTVIVAVDTNDDDAVAIRVNVGEPNGEDNDSTCAASGRSKSSNTNDENRERRRVAGERTSSSSTRQPLAAATGDAKTNAAIDRRRRLNKRTMTRDDIDIHKPRRGTPNITITEPSFCHPTITYQHPPISGVAHQSRSHKSTSTGRRARATRQTSLTLAAAAAAAAAETTMTSTTPAMETATMSTTTTSSGDRDTAATEESARDEFSQSSGRRRIRRFISYDESKIYANDQKINANDDANDDNDDDDDDDDDGDNGDKGDATNFYGDDRGDAKFSSASSKVSRSTDHRAVESRGVSSNSSCGNNDNDNEDEYGDEDQDEEGRERRYGERDEFPMTEHSSEFRPPIFTTPRQHRPSVIREDSDAEKESLGGGGGGNKRIASGEDAKMHCGLSTTTFEKKSYLSRQPRAIQMQNSFDQFKDGSLELISFEEENYEKHYYGREHWNYFTNDELLGPVMLSLKQEVNNQRDHFHVLLRTVSYTLHGTIPASTICADRYDREAIVKELSEIAKLKPPLMLGQLASTPDELLKLDHIFIKTELKVGVIYIKSGQAESEESILGNREESPLFAEFLDILGDRITLKGFDRYKGGLDTVHNLTGTESVYTMWRNIEIMFHVSTMLPHEENDPQKLQKKRHIGNDIVCVAFIESDDIQFWPGCIKSYFLHTFITVCTSPKPLAEGEKRKYSVSCVCRNEVQYAFKPYLIEKDEFTKSDYFREWLLVKIVNGERASYSAPKFARMQDRTRSQLLEDIITNLTGHLVTGQMPRPYRRGSWRPLGHTRASSPLDDSMKDSFEAYEQLAKDFCDAFCGPCRSILCDVAFKVKDRDGAAKLVHGVRAIMAIRSRTFLEMLYGFAPPGAGPASVQNQTNLRAIEMKALAGESSSSTTSRVGGSEFEPSTSKSLFAKRGSVGADSGRRTGEKERRQSMLPNLSKSAAQKPNYLTVPSTSGGSGAGGGGGTGGMIKNAFNRLVFGNWSGWSGNMKSYKGEQTLIKVEQDKSKIDPHSLAICKEISKIDPEKLAQREFEIKEFDYETFQQTIEYIHNGQCRLSYDTIPGLICAAEHYDLPDLLHACFHHANTHMKLSAAPKMMNALYQNSCFYDSAMQLLDSIYEFIDPLGNEFFSRSEYTELYESVFTTLLTRKTLQVSELKKFLAMIGWAERQIHIKQKEKLRQNMSSNLHNDLETGWLERMQLREQQQPIPSIHDNEETQLEFGNLFGRINKTVNIKLDKICNEDLVNIVLPTKVFLKNHDKIFDIMANESRNEY